MKSTKNFNNQLLTTTFFLLIFYQKAFKTTKSVKYLTLLKFILCKMLFINFKISEKYLYSIPNKYPVQNYGSLIVARFYHISDKQILFFLKMVKPLNVRTQFQTFCTSV